MAELAWPTDLGHGTFVGRFGFMDADGPDTDRSPDITSATGGTVEIAPNVSSIRYTGSGGPMILAARTAKGIIDSEGYLCTVAANGGSGVRGMVFPATDDTDLSPTDWSYRVTVRLEGGITLSPFNVKLPAGATVDLSLATPVSASGGTAVVVDTATADRAVQAAAAAEASAVKAAGYATGVPWNNVTSKPTTFAPAAHSHAWSTVTAKPATFPPETHTHAWADITSKPTTFTPSTHTHTIANITGLQAALDGNQATLTPADLAALGVSLQVEYTGTAWPARPATTASVTWVSTRHPAAPYPPTQPATATGMAVGDMVIRHPEAS